MNPLGFRSWEIWRWPPIVRGHGRLGRTYFNAIDEGSDEYNKLVADSLLRSGKRTRALRYLCKTALDATTRILDARAPGPGARAPAIDV